MAKGLIRRNTGYKGMAKIGRASSISERPSFNPHQGISLSSYSEEAVEPELTSKNAKMNKKDRCGSRSRC